MNRFRSLLAAALLLMDGLASAARVENEPGTAHLSGPQLPGRTWQAKWIWTEGDPAPRNAYAYFRRTFTLKDREKDAKLHVTADSRYQVFVNGQRVGRGPVRSDRRWLYYDTWSVGANLAKGENTIAVLVHHIGESTFSYMQGRGGFLAELVDDGGKPLIRTDASWKALRSEAWGTDPKGGHGQPRMSIQLGFNEIFDARQEPKGWKDRTFPDMAWPAAKELGEAGMEPWTHLIARDIPLMREEPMLAKQVLEVAEVAPAPEGPGPLIVSKVMAAERRAPLATAAVDSPGAAIAEGDGAKVRTAPGADVSFLIDFGREVTGYPHFRVRGARGGEIVDLGYGEVLQDDKGGFVAPASGEKGRLNPDRDNVHYADRFVLAETDTKDGREFETFEKRGFRYLQLDVRNAPAGLTLNEVGLLFSTFPVQELGSFQCSDERLNRIWETGRYTCQLNMEDAYTDCPWRERGQWWGDARVEGLINYYCFGDTTLIRKCLRQQGQSLNDEGLTWGVYPTDWMGGRLPSFTLIWIATLWDYYRYTGDRELVAELFPKVRYSLGQFFQPRVAPDGLLKDVPYWVFIDWAPVDTAGECGALNAYYYDALRRAADMARMLGLAPAAAEYDKQADAVRAGMNTRLWDPERHVYRDSVLPSGEVSPKISQQTNSLCVLYDIAPQAEHAAILDFIYDPKRTGPDEKKVVEAGSPYFSYYQLAALFHANRYKRGMAYIRERWGRMLDWGATTWWEMWQPGASFCHGWSGGPTYNLGAEVLGAAPLRPGWAEASITPHTLDLTFASGVVPTVKGDVKVAWQRDPKTHHMALRLETPPAMPAEVTLPITGDFQVNRKSRLPEGVSRLESPAGTLRFRVAKGGTWLFDVEGK